MYTSFYGGRPGANFTIKKTYSSLNQMKEDLAGYSPSVGYGEYVMVDASPLKNDPAHGSIFYRGINNNNVIPNLVVDGEPVSCGYAVYVGNILGPIGPSSVVEIKTAAEFEQGPQNIEEGSKSPTYTSSMSVNNGQLVSGANHNTIDYEWYSFNEMQGDDAVNKVWMKPIIPYPVVDIQFEVAGKEEAASLKMEDNDNPFYTKYLAKFRNGIDGSSSQIKIKTESNKNIIQVYDTTVDDSGNPTTSKTDEVTLKELSSMGFNDKGELVARYTTGTSQVVGTVGDKAFPSIYVGGYREIDSSVFAGGSATIQDLENALNNNPSLTRGLSGLCLFSNEDINGGLPLYFVKNDNDTTHPWHHVGGLGSQLVFTANEPDVMSMNTVWCKIRSVDE